MAELGTIPLVPQSLPRTSPAVTQIHIWAWGVAPCSTPAWHVRGSGFHPQNYKKGKEKPYTYCAPREEASQGSQMSLQFMSFRHLQRRMPGSRPAGRSRGQLGLVQEGPGLGGSSPCTSRVAPVLGATLPVLGSLLPGVWALMRECKQPLKFCANGELASCFPGEKFAEFSKMRSHEYFLPRRPRPKVSQLHGIKGPSSPLT